ncbi:MAG: aminoglycoside phosphotransferase family protein [Alphaproteobacteria bacterium]|nr:aminoglycoside phosphotransferase family protein [Alphaproteobacteria bacterium]
MTPAQAADRAEALLGWRGAATALDGGLLNHVFRIRGDGRTVVLKHAPPHIASAPDVPLDPARATFEARALAAAGGAPGPGLSSPRLLAHDGPVLIMEDIGELPDLATALAAGPVDLEALGRGLRGLHERADAPRLHNLGIQQTRLALQYRPVGTWLADAGIPDAAALGDRARVLGELLLAPGDVWVHGDLWPPSVRVAAECLVLIDWEFSTTGRRCQDLGHLAAHLWMQADRGRIDPDSGRALLQGYGRLEERDRSETAVHLGCEILARTVGAFVAGFLYDAVPDAARQHAVCVAAEAIRTGQLPTA